MLHDDNHGDSAGGADDLLQCRASCSASRVQQLNPYMRIGPREIVVYPEMYHSHVTS